MNKMKKVMKVLLAAALLTVLSATAVFAHGPGYHGGRWYGRGGMNYGRGYGYHRRVPAARGRGWYYGGHRRGGYDRGYHRGYGYRGGCGWW